MLGGLLNRVRRPQTPLAFNVATAESRLSNGPLGNFAVSLDGSTGRATALWHVEGTGYVTLGEARGMDAAEAICQAAAVHLMAGRALMPMRVAWDRGGDRDQAVTATRTMAGGLSLALFSRPEECVRLTPETVADLLTGYTVIKRMGERGSHVKDGGSVLEAILAKDGLLGPEEGFEGKWGSVRHRVRKAHNSSVGADEVAADHVAIDTLRAHEKATAGGFVPEEVGAHEAAKAASRLWDNFDVRRHISDTPVAGMLEGLAETHDRRVQTDLYHPGR